VLGQWKIKLKELRIKGRSISKSKIEEKIGYQEIIVVSKPRLSALHKELYGLDYKF